MSDARISQIETAIATLAAQQKGLTEDLASLSVDVSRLADSVSTSLSKMNDAYKDGQRPQWGVIFAGFSAVVVILGWFVTAQLAPMAKEIDYLRERRQELTTLPERIGKIEDFNRLWLDGKIRNGP